MNSRVAKLDKKRIARLRKALLAWYRRHRRNLPWRSDPEPYKVWIAEVMAQQTRLDTVIPFFESFMKRFPDLEALASSPEERVLEAWSGLGYYRRARLLHRTSKILLSEHDGELPSDPEELQRLPGIGRYTAGAIASVAFGVPAPILDGNVSRVLTRLLDLADEIDRSDTKRTLWELAEQLVPKDAASDFNQSMMELGALLCTPRNPDCRRCPIRSMCHARLAGTVEQRPVQARTRKARAQSVLALLARRAGDEHLLMVRHPDQGLFAGLWSVPTWPPPWAMDGSCQIENNLLKLEAKFRKLLGIDLRIAKRRHSFTHLLTHRRLEVEVFQAKLPQDRPEITGYRAHRFVGTILAMRRLGLSNLTQRILKID